MALESSPCTGSMVRNNLHSPTHQLSTNIFNNFNEKRTSSNFVYYLKLGWGVILGVFPSITPRSLMVRDPPGSSRALRRSRTEALSTEYTISSNCQTLDNCNSFFSLRPWPCSNCNDSNHCWSYPWDCHDFKPHFWNYLWFDISWWVYMLFNVQHLISHQAWH